MTNENELKREVEKKDTNKVSEKPESKKQQQKDVEKTGQSERNDLTSNSSTKARIPSEHLDIDADQDRQPTPSTSGPKGTEEPGSDEGPGGTGW